MIKMIIVDLDGTLLNEEGKITENTKKYLCSLKEKGYIIIIATGRTCTSALTATDGAKFASFIIFNQGSCIYEIPTKKYIFEHYINKTQLSKILDFYDQTFHYIEIASNTVNYKLWNHFENNDLVKSINKKEDVLALKEPISRITIFKHKKEDILKLYKQLKSTFLLNVLLMQDSFTDHQWIDITPMNCTKMNTILWLAKYLNLNSNEMITFGDGLNDIEMLKKCGYGVAMQNALPEVKKAADFTTIYDYNHDGVINFLKKIINE